MTLWHLKHYTQRRILFCKYVVIFDSKEIANDSFEYTMFVYAKFIPRCINRTGSRNTAECTFLIWARCVSADVRLETETL